MAAWGKIIDWLVMAHNGCSAMLIGCHKAAIHDQLRQGLSDRPFWPNYCLSHRRPYGRVAAAHYCAAAP